MQKLELQGQPFTRLAVLREAGRSNAAGMGERPANTSLGRFLDTGDYRPGNCKWMTYREQSDEKVKTLAGC